MTILSEMLSGVHTSASCECKFLYRLLQAAPNFAVHQYDAAIGADDVKTQTVTCSVHRKVETKSEGATKVTCFAGEPTRSAQDSSASRAAQKMLHSSTSNSMLIRYLTTVVSGEMLPRQRVFAKTLRAAAQPCLSGVHDHCKTWLLECLQRITIGSYVM